MMLKSPRSSPLFVAPCWPAERRCYSVLHIRCAVCARHSAQRLAHVVSCSHTLHRALPLTTRQRREKTRQSRTSGLRPFAKHLHTSPPPPDISTHRCFRGTRATIYSTLPIPRSCATGRPLAALLQSGLNSRPCDQRARRLQPTRIRI